jgi:hypothetical protein
MYRETPNAADARVPSSVSRDDLGVLCRCYYRILLPSIRPRSTLEYNCPALSNYATGIFAAYLWYLRLKTSALCGWLASPNPRTWHFPPAFSTKPLRSHSAAPNLLFRQVFPRCCCSCWIHCSCLETVGFAGPISIFLFLSPPPSTSSLPPLALRLFHIFPRHGSLTGSWLSQDHVTDRLRFRL